jgi:hypothetical protein
MNKRLTLAQKKYCILRMLQEDGIVLSPIRRWNLELLLPSIDFEKLQQDRHAYLTARQLLNTHGKRYAQQWLEIERTLIWGEQSSDRHVRDGQRKRTA